MLLVEFAVGSSSRNNTSNVRKITPISTESTVSAPMSDKQLQVRLLISEAVNIAFYCLS